MAIPNYQPGELASYACHPEQSRGRLHPEEESNTRSCFQRDRDRIIHSTAFRRLEYKTQVFVNHEGDHYRTRLTHSLEVSQLARSIARTLGLNEDLAETLALAHDLGHTPFGHAGEEALAEAMSGYGGFNHNAHTLRIVTSLEHRYAEFDGLNLTWETLEGIAKHNGPLIRRSPASILSKLLHKPQEHALPRAISEYNARHDLELEHYASGEAQVAALADDIAYSNHDIDDGLRAGLFTLEQLERVDMVARIIREVRVRYPALNEHRLIHEAIRRLINRMVTDLITQTAQNIASEHVEKADDIRRLGRPLVEFSPPMQDANQQLKDFLMENMYRHYKVNRMASKARRIVGELFQFFLAEPQCLPTSWQQLASGPKGAVTATVTADFIAGMTDRFAIEEYRRIFDVTTRAWVSL
ncbi:MAG: deoxyguanosinetriphosphate triphosphohydrolase [Pseudomonadota bacterium]|nr:deoxyguanosinetriphosphate triphosphohydrolase [Pseudomonadota bacterium]